MDNWGVAARKMVDAARELQREIDEIGCGDPLKKENADLRRQIEEALGVAENAIYEGDHHRMWVIDQMVRVLAGDKYQEWVGSCGDDWDEGIAPEGGLMHILQRTLDGGAEIAGLTPIQRQLAQIMWDEPETQGDEDLLAARWLTRHAGFPGADVGYLAHAICLYRKADIRRRRRQELRDAYPYSQDEERRRQKRAKGGPPG